MRTVRLDHKFKAVLVHDAISYMLTENDLRQVFATAAAHLDAGGVFLTSPDWLRESFFDPHVSASTHTDSQVILTLIEYAYDPDPTDTTIETRMWYLIRESGELRVEEETHVLGLFPSRTWIDLMEGAGFDVEMISYEASDEPRQGSMFAGLLRGE